MKDKTQDVINENFSDNSRGRGRPPLLTDKVRLKMALLYPGISERHLQNKVYLVKGFSWFRDHDELAWLFEGKNGNPGEWRRMTIISELGRFHSAAAAYDAALYLCQWQPPTGEALPWIRRCRRAALIEAIFSLAGL